MKLALSLILFLTQSVPFAMATSYCSMGPKPFEFSWSSLSPDGKNIFYLRTKMQGVEKKNNNRTWAPFAGYELVVMNLTTGKKSVVGLPRFSDLGWAATGVLVAPGKVTSCLDVKSMTWSNCTEDIVKNRDKSKFVLSYGSVTDSSDDVEWTEKYELLSVKMGEKLVAVTDAKEGKQHYIVNCGD